MKQPILRTACLMLAGCLIASQTHAQLKLLKDASDAIKSGTDAIKQVSNMVDSTKKTTSEFNKSVKVVKDNIPAGITSSKTTKPKFKNGKFSNFYWEPVAQFDKQVFPAMIITMAGYKGQIDDEVMNSVKSSALGFYFVGEKPSIPIKWEIECLNKTYFDKASGDFTMENVQQNYCFMPSLPWNMETLAAQAVPTQLSIIYRIYDDAGHKEERSETIFLRSVYDCILQYQQKKFDFLLTTFIQDEHPEVQAILKESQNIKFTSMLTGYTGNDLQTMMQVCAVWKVLHDRGLQYHVMSNALPASSQSISSQQVHTFSAAIKMKQANCIDGTIVMASLLRALGISTIMVVSNNHCFLGFYTSKGVNRKLVYLETTMLSESDFLDAAKNAKEKDKAYVSQFKAALDAGSSMFAKYGIKAFTGIDVDFYKAYVQPLP